MPHLMQIIKIIVGRRNRKQCGKTKSSIASCISQLHPYNVAFLHCVNMHKKYERGAFDTSSDCKASFDR